MGRLDFVSRRVVAAEERAFSALGRLTARRPWTIICLVSTFYVAMLPGVLLLKGEVMVLGLHLSTDFLKSYALTDSEEYSQYMHGTGIFPGTRAVGMIEKPLNGKAALSADVLRAALALEAHITASLHGKHKGRDVVFADVCARNSANAPCRYVSAASTLLGTGSAAEAKLQQLAAMEANATVSASSRAQWLLQGMPRATDRYLLSLFFGAGTVASFPGGGASDAALAAWLVTVKALTARLDLGDDDASVAFETEAERYFHDDAKSSVLGVSVFSTGSIGREAAGIGLSVLPLLFATIALMATYVMTFLVAETRGRKDTQILVVAVGLGIPAGSTLGGLGLMGYLGLHLSVIALMAPFLGLAVGVDAVFLVLTSVSVQNEEEDLSEVMAKAMSRAGVAATASTATSSCAFAVAAITTSNFPGFCYFSILLCAILMLNWVGMVTMLPACVVLNERRIASGRRDVLPCLKRKRGDGAPRPGLLTRLAVGHRCRGIIANYAAPALERSLGCQLVGAAVWVGLLALGIPFIPKLGKGMPDTYFIIDSSPANDYFRDAESAFGKVVGIDVNILFEAPKLGDRAFREALVNYTSALAARADAVAPPDCWLSPIVRAASPQATAGQVALAARAFLGSVAGAAYGWDARIGANGQVEAARCHFLVWQPTEAKARDDQAADIVSLTKSSGTGASAYHISWPIHVVRYREILNMTLSSAAYVVITVAVCLVLLFPLHLAFLAFINVVAVLTVLFGFMAAVGINCHAISYTVVVMSVGFCVDYSCHVMHFSEHGVEPGLPWDLRMGRSLRECGFDVMQGCATAFMGVALLGWHGSDAFRIFSALSLVITGTGGVFALWGLPALIALIARACRGGRPAPHCAGAEGDKTEVVEI